MIAAIIEDSLRPETFRTSRPMILATPVWVSPLLRINTAQTVITAGLLHPASASAGVTRPVIAVVPKDGLEDKLKSNIQEVLARNGQVYLFADERVDVMDMGGDCRVIRLPASEADVAPILFSVALQLLAYYVAVRKGTDVDQPRNLAKSVTVE